MEHAEKEMYETSEEQQSSIRKYLLGSLDDKMEMRRIEENLLLDDDFAERLSIAEDELVVEFLDGELNESEREQFQRFFLASPKNRENLRLIENLRKYAAKQSVAGEVESKVKEDFGWFGWRKLFLSPAWSLALGVLLIFGVGFGVWRVAFYQTDAERGLSQLRLAYRGQRPFESRTTAGFEYAPLSVTRGPSSPPNDSRARIRAENFLLGATEDSSDAKAHQALGILYLAEGKFDKALGEFDSAVKSAPNDAKIYNDMGAAFLEKAVQAEHEEKFDESLQARALSLKSLNRALELDNSSLEALFNRALVLQKMAVNNQAREAWEAYLKKDSVSPWADEARKNLDILKSQAGTSKDKSQILNDYLDAFHRQNSARAWEIVSQTKELVSGTMIQPQLSRKFLEAETAHQKEEAADLLAAFVYLGELEKQHAKDLYFAELADYYSKTNPAQRQILLSGYDELQKGHELMLKPDFKLALTFFNRAKDLFSAAGNNWEAQLAEHRICYCLSRLDEIRQSNQRLLLLSEFCERNQYKWLQTLADGWAGESFYFLGESSKAIRYNQNSLKSAQLTFDAYNVHRALIQLAEAYKSIGEESKAFDATYRNLALTETYHTFPRQRWRDLNYASETLHRFKYFDAALVYGSESISVAEQNQDNWMLRTSRRNLTRIYADSQRFSEAYEQIERALQLSQTFADANLRNRLIADSHKTLADLQRQSGDCLKAAENYNQAFETYRQMEIAMFNFDAGKGRLLCSIAQNNDAAVKAEIAALLQSFDEERRKIHDESDRNTFFDAEQNVYDIAIEYAHAQLKDQEQAFNYAENSRARSLLNLVQNDSEIGQPLNFNEFRDNVPPRAQIIYYAVLPDKILIWFFSDSKTAVVEKAIRADDLENKISAYTKLLIQKADEARLNEQAKELYSLLIEPVETLLENDKTLCVIADKSLFRLPFASLVSPKTNAYLVENHEILIAPSASIFVIETKNAERKSALETEVLLSIGNPSFSGREYPNLPNLPSAEREASEIAAFYDSAQVYTEKQADKSQMVGNIGAADVVHFAGHYLPNSKSPALSKFVLAAGDLSVEEITQMKLARPRLLILSACETGVETFYKGEGMIGAARAFLASDVPLVAASQWSIDSEASTELMIKFHRNRKLRRLTTVAALRQAQIELLRDENPRFRQPFYWAGFLLVGGHTKY